MQCDGKIHGGVSVKHRRCLCRLATASYRPTSDSISSLNCQPPKYIGSERHLNVDLGLVQLFYVRTRWQDSAPHAKGLVRSNDCTPHWFCGASFIRLSDTLKSWVIWNLWSCWRWSAVGLHWHWCSGRRMNSSSCGSGNPGRSQRRVWGHEQTMMTFFYEYRQELHQLAADIASELSDTSYILSVLYMFNTL